MKQYIVTSTNPPFQRRRDRRFSFGPPIQKVSIYDCVEEAGQNGITANDIALRVKFQIDRVRFHLSELKRAGLISVRGEPTTVTVTMNATEAAFAAMLGLENALVARVREEKKVSPELDRAFVKYSKLKELALRPGTTHEGKSALKMAVLELVKMVF